MKLEELKAIIKRLYREHIKYHLKVILLCLVLSIIVAASSSATAWLLDPAVKKIFIDKDQTLAWLIPLAIIVAFASKGVSPGIVEITDKRENGLGKKVPIFGMSQTPASPLALCLNMLTCSPWWKFQISGKNGSKNQTWCFTTRGTRVKRRESWRWRC